jgi:hypothetical protein
MRKLLSLLVAASLLGACGGGGGDSGGPPSVVAVYTSFGSAQCSGGGSTLSDLQARLLTLGIRVFAERCGLDGLAHVSVCGQPDGRIAVFDIDEAQVAAALLIGFALLSTLPNATTTSCP